MPPDSIPVSARPAYGRSQLSPALPPHQFALEIADYPAIDENGDPTVALYAAGRLSGWYEAVYGGRMAGAVQIVAMDERTGMVYNKNAERGKPVPLALAMNPTPTAPPRGVASVESTELYFAVDLRRQLRLPAYAADYSVFLWLDEMTSQVLRIQMPGTPRTVADVDIVQPPAGFVQREPGAAAPAGGAPMLVERGGLVYGAVAALPASQDVPPPTGFALLGLDFRSRQFKFGRLPFLNQVVNAFDFDPVKIFGPDGWLDSPAPPRRVFLLVASPGAISPVVTFQLP